MKNLSLIAAVGKNNELGKDNQLIWRFKEDMKYFKNCTIYHPIIMGRKTFESLPKVLPYRLHVVLSHHDDIEIPDVKVVHSREELLDFVYNYHDRSFVIGGGNIYNLLIDDVDTMFLTEIDDVCYDADTYFPDFNKDEWNRLEIDSHRENDIDFKHVKYTRKLVKGRF